MSLVRCEVAFRLVAYLLGLYLGGHDGVVDYVWSVDGVDWGHPVFEEKGVLVKSKVHAGEVIGLNWVSKNMNRDRRKNV